MAEAATSVTPFARAHLNVGTVHQDGAKMAKSTGNLTLVTDLLHDHPPAAVRLLVLNRPWHTPWEYQPADLDQAAADLETLYTAAGQPGTSPAATNAVTRALLDNLDVPAPWQLPGTAAATPPASCSASCHSPDAGCTDRAVGSRHELEASPP
jgi:cysteinyl-tRNA synthetase